MGVARGGLYVVAVLAGANPNVSHPAKTFAAQPQPRNAFSMNSLHVLWIDGVGGYAMCDQSTTTLGGAASSNAADLRVSSDLPSRSAVFHRQGQDLLVEPLHQVSLNGKEISTTCLLSHGDLIRLGSSVELVFQQPTQLSGTALLTLKSRHRWHGSIDGALLLGHSCLLGPSPKAHVRCPNWEKDIVLFRNRDQWMVRCDEYSSEGSERSGATRPVELGKRIQGPDFSMTWL